MKRIVLLLLAVFVGIRVFAQVNLTVEAPTVVAVGERFRVIFTVDTQGASFTSPALDDFLVLAGPTTSTMYRSETINGRRTQTRTSSYTFVLEARKEGTFQIPPASVEVDGTVYKSKSSTIEVVKGQQQAAAQSAAADEGGAAVTNVSNDDIFMRLSVSKKKVVKGESLVATLKLYTRVNIAGVEDVQFPTFNGFWSQEAYAPQQLEFQRENVNGEIYQAAVLRRYVLLPQQTGALKIDPSELTCLIQVRSAARGNSLLDDFFDSYQTVRKRVLAPAVTLQVENLPAGAPASFSGAVGKFSITSKMSKDSLLAHDAVSLIVTLSGEGNINLVETPKLTFPPDFETYDAKVTDNSRNSGGQYAGTKVFEYPVIPRSHGEFTIDPVEFSYFDISSRSYKTIRTSPIELKVGKNDASDSGVAMSSSTVRRSVQSLGDDIRYIQTPEQQWRKRQVFFIGSVSFYVLFALIALLFTALYVGMNKMMEKRKDVVRVRNSKANKIARARLKTAEQLLKQQLFAGFYEEVHRTLWGYIGDKLALSQADCSRDKVTALLHEKHVQESLVTEFTELIEACEFARYAPDPGQVEKEKIYDRAVSLISQLEQGLK